MSHRRAFTLIELLVVVGIIAILAAIAMPNFLQAQTRAKTSRAMADMRSLATALEAYAVDWNLCPPCNAFGTPGNRAPTLTEPYVYLELLSSPIAYITNAFPEDPFHPTDRLPIAEHDQIGRVEPQPVVDPAGPQWRAYTYTSWNARGRTTASGGGFDIKSLPQSWLLQSAGPDRQYFNTGGILENFSEEESLDLVYDPTNGVVSFGAIFRVGGAVSSGHGAGFDHAIRPRMGN
ncbi:type II secretion system protein [Candidatus Sumerlaeota bacterium]|nr:type II secretion system protein [Candidatus Sumerlaeota bacterium]